MSRISSYALIAGRPLSSSTASSGSHSRSNLSKISHLAISAAESPSYVCVSALATSRQNDVGSAELKSEICRDSAIDDAIWPIDLSGVSDVTLTQAHPP